MKKIITLLFVVLIIFTTVFTVSAAIGDNEYARYIASMENTVDNIPINFSIWPGCKMPVTWTLQTAIKDPLSGSNAMKISCSDNKVVSEWHASGYWNLTNEYSNWQGTQYLEFWIKNDTGFNFALQIQLTEFDKNNQPAGEPWRTKVKSPDVLYEESGAFVKRGSDVSSAETYNEYANNSEGAIAIPKNYTGRIRIAINANNFYRATWFVPGDGSNNTIDKDKLAQMSFNYDPRVVDNNSTWYLDSIKLVAPNANLYKSVAYSKLDVKNETNIDSQISSTSSVVSSTSSKPIQSSSSSQSTSNNSSVTSTVSSSSSKASSSVSSISSKATEEKGGMSTGAIIIMIIAIVIIVAGGGAVAFILIKAKKGI